VRSKEKEGPDGVRQVSAFTCFQGGGMHR